MRNKRFSVRTTLVIAVGIGLLGVTVTPVSTADTHTESVRLTFETGPDGEGWEDPSDTDFGYVDFSVYTPSTGRGNPAVVRNAATPDQPSGSLNVITNQNPRGEPGWLNMRFREGQSNPRFVLWLDPRDEQVDRYGNSNTLHVRGYDSADNRVYDERSQLRAGGYVFNEVDSRDPSARISRVAVSIRPLSGPGFSRFYVSSVEFEVRPPEVGLTVSPTRPESGERVYIGANVETAGEITEYEWFVDGRRYPTSDGQSIRPSLSTGSHTVAIRVTDRLGLQETASRTVTVEQPPDPLPFLVAVAAVITVLIAFSVLVVRRVRG